MSSASNTESKTILICCCCVCEGAAVPRWGDLQVQRGQTGSTCDAWKRDWMCFLSPHSVIFCLYWQFALILSYFLSIHLFCKKINRIKMWGVQRFVDAAAWLVQGVATWDHPGGDAWTAGFLLAEHETSICSPAAQRKSSLTRDKHWVQERCCRSVDRRRTSPVFMSSGRSRIHRRPRTSWSDGISWKRRSPRVTRRKGKILL